MKTIAQLPTIEEAHLLRMILAEEGIEAVVLDEGMGGHFLGPGSVFADFRVQVAEEQVERARPFVEQFTERESKPEPESQAAAAPVGSAKRGIPLRLFQTLSLVALLLHFVNRQVLHAQAMSVTQELRLSLDALAAYPSVVAFLGRFGLVWEVIYGAALLGFAALWRRARVCFLIAWIWSAVYIAAAGPDATHGIPYLISFFAELLGVFLLGVSFCQPAAEHFGSKSKK